MPAQPISSWPTNTTFSARNVGQKCSLPSRSLIIRPNIFGNQK